MNSSATSRVFEALETFRIEIPSWGFANTGTRFGKFSQPAAATSTEEKFSDAGEVHRLTGICPTIALHVLWDFPEGLGSANQQRIEIDSSNRLLKVDRDSLVMKSSPESNLGCRWNLDRLTSAHPLRDILCGCCEGVNQVLRAGSAGRLWLRYGRFVPGG